MQGANGCPGAVQLAFMYLPSLNSKMTRPKSLPRLPFAALLIAATATLHADLAAQNPQPLLSTVTAVPASAQAWAAAEQARNPMVTAQQFVTIDTATLRNTATVGPMPLATLDLDLFGTSKLLDINEVDWTNDRLVFTCSVRGHSGGALLVMSSDDTVFGQIQFDDQTYALLHSSHSNVHVLHRLDPSLLPANMGCACGRQHAISAPPAPPPTGAGFTGANTDCGKTTIDILVFYTPLARQAAGGQTAIENTIVGAIANMNAGHLASGVEEEVRLVHMAETNYQETGATNDLSRFRSTSDGHMDEVHALRQTYGGDLMHLITQPSSLQYCGVGYLMRNLTTNFRTSAFAVTVRSCISNQTFSHECGHNLGSHHDPANAGPALYPYSYGYRTPNNAYRTIMSYSPGQRVNRWSSPTVTYSGFTMGNATQDNKQSLNNARLTSSQFYPTTVPRWCDLDGGIPGLLGVPEIVGSGTINGAEPLTATVRRYRPNTIGALFIGLSAINVPLFGGTLVPSLDLAVTLSGGGLDLTYDASWLANAPAGSEVWMQAAFIDTAATQSWSASDAVKVTRP